VPIRRSGHVADMVLVLVLVLGSASASMIAPALVTVIG
jgi:hypothetical protein